MTREQETLQETVGFAEPEPFSVRAQGLELGVYPGGKDRLAALQSTLRDARRSLKLVFYIFAMDETARLVRDALAQAAKRGVAVTLILDGFGAKADDSFLAPLTEAGGRVLRFSPRWNVRYLIRNHQKIVIADDQVAMIGGFNIEDSYFEPPEKDGWSDLGVTVSGPAVQGLVRWFAALEQWTADGRAQFLAIRRLVREWEPGEGPVQWLVGGPTRWLSSWARRVIRDIECGARLDMMMAYFSPRVRLVKRIDELAERGAARLLLAGKSDNGATIGAARSLYGRLLKHGAEIFEFQASMLHTKLIVVDDTVYIGSANFDFRSLYLNLELMLRIEDAALAERMRAFITAHIPASEKVTYALHCKRRTLWKRIRWTLSWFLVAVVDYTVVRRLNLGLEA